MKMILRTALQCQILALLLLLSACSSIPARTTASLAQGPLQIEVEALRIASNLPALGVLEIRNGVVVQSAMTGVRKWGDPTPALITDQFHLGSCTKAMTATLFAMLVDEGKVRWNSTLSEQFPEISNMNPVFKSVTLEMLLAHRGGLITSFKHINAGKLQAQLQDEKTTPSAGRQLLAETLLSAAPSFPPGSQFNYANAGYIIVGRVIEKLSGQTWEQFITQRLFQPLQMKSCGFGPPGNPLASPPRSALASSLDAARIEGNCALSLFR